MVSKWANSRLPPQARLIHPGFARSSVLATPRRLSVRINRPFVRSFAPSLLVPRPLDSVKKFALQSNCWTMR